MAQKYRIYINEKVILVTESVPKNVERYQKIDAQTFDLKTFYNEFNGKPGGKFYFLLCADAKAYLNTVMKSIGVIEAAGGMVENAKGEYLFIYRNDKWDLPKGKIEKGEKKREGAVREVEEECGITVSSIGDKICKTYHTYGYKGEVVLKRTHWYRMAYTGTEKLKPQKEEGITDVRWFRKGHIDAIVKNTFPSIMDVLAKMDLFKDKPAPLSE
ncbi:MAG TPA: NUDIX domain-containing protein [Mucilaginibacter sp.]|nr:NUDIX domain-containing protein [Mucilaginibacter sp.]